MNPLRWRKMTRLILGFTGLMILWIGAGLGNVVDNCAEYALGTSARAACETGTGIGAGLAFTMIFLVWFVGFIVLSIIWFMTKPSRRVCPACGFDVTKGRSACKKCGFDVVPAAMHAPGSLAPQ